MSTVPAAKAALKALMEAWTWPGVQPVIRWGGPTEGEDFAAGGQMIYLGDTTEMTDEPIVLGYTRWDETYELRVVIDIIQYGDDEQATEIRAWELYASFASLLNDNRTLAGAIHHTTSHTVRQLNIPSPNQWRTQIVVDTECVGYVDMTNP